MSDTNENSGNVFAAMQASAPEQAPVEQAPEQPVIEKEQEPEVEPEVEPEPAATAESVLSDLLRELEGAPHMSKPEILAIIDGARASAAQL